MSKKKKKRKASFNYDTRLLADRPSAEVLKIKEPLKEWLYKIAKGHNLPETYDSIDILICRPKSYTRKIMQYGHVGRMIELRDEVNDFIGIGRVREVFRDWIKNNNLTIASVSRVLFPEKSASYLSSVLNEDHSGTYSDEFVNEAFLKAKRLQENGLLKMDGKTIQETALDVADDLSTKKEVLIKKTTKEKKQTSTKKQGAEDKVVIFVTNYDTRQQTSINLGELKLNELNNFWKSLESVGAINKDVEFAVIVDDSTKKD
ncbi:MULTISPECIES: hypothetical protein [Enterococcus]|uniref:Uncharacterized protein n=1 Tax=Enterococcus dongliensis TaxID=2559925 RepID=A0AAW8TI10_9ENTE|nr:MULTISPECIES: hypothetical protein [Enterococcus]MDT2554755.1 hypothetical protein [Enterococcus raffinosus]MDT2637939.1 hypothetical protein [Enterococcus dongliensis]